MSDIKFKMGRLEYSQVAQLHGEKVAQALWEKKGNNGPYIHWCVAIPAWMETTSGAILGFEESERADQLLKDILNDAKGHI